MSLLLSFLASHLLPALEAAFVAHEPEMQQALLDEVEALVEKMGAWVKTKMEHQ